MCVKGMHYEDNVPIIVDYDKYGILWAVRYDLGTLVASLMNYGMPRANWKRTYCYNYVRCY